MKIGASVLAFLGAAFIGAQADALPAYDQSQPRTVVFEGHGEAAYGGAVSAFCYDCDGADGSSDFKSDVSPTRSRATSETNRVKPERSWALAPDFP